MNKTNKIVTILMTFVIIIAIIWIVVGMFLFVNSDKKESNDNELNNNTKEENNDSSNSNVDLTEKEYTGSKQNITIATIGNEYYEKSALTSMLTKLYGKYVTTDQIVSAPEVTKNSIKYNASFIEYETQTKHYSHYDLPKKVDYIKALMSGSIKLDGAIFVVDAMNITTDVLRDNLKLLEQIGVSKIVVYINRVDMISDKELLDINENIIRDSLFNYGFDRDNTPIIMGSSNALDGNKNGETSIHELMTSVDKWIDKKTSNEISSNHTEFKAGTYFLLEEENGKQASYTNNSKLQFLISSSTQNGTITLSKNIEKVVPGTSMDITVTLSKATSFKIGDNFQIYDEGKLVGIGVIESIVK